MQTTGDAREHTPTSAPTRTRARTQAANMEQVVQQLKNEKRDAVSKAVEQLEALQANEREEAASLQHDQKVLIAPVFSPYLAF